MECVNMKKQELLKHIDKLIEFDIGEEVIVLSLYSKLPPQFATIKDITIKRLYDSNTTEYTYNVTYMITYNHSKDQIVSKVDQKYVKKYTKENAEKTVLVLNTINELYGDESRIVL